MTYDTKKVIADFRSERGQLQEPPKVDEKPERKRRNGVRDPYNMFLYKYQNMTKESVNKWGSRDLVFYFRETANMAGYKYVITNMNKERAIMKRAMDSFSNSEICGMIEFLYLSEQDYLKKDRLSPNLLSSRWVNTIYADMQLWVNDEYFPNKPKKLKHEWSSSDEQKEASIIGVEL